MRTTLDLDERVLAAARAMASADGISIGAAVSTLALRGLLPPPMPTDELGLPTVRAGAGHVVTDELVARYRDDD